MEFGVDKRMFMSPGEREEDLPGFEAEEFVEPTGEHSNDLELFKAPWEKERNQEVMEEAQLERLGVMGGVLLSRVREYANEHPKFAKFLGEGGNHLWGIGDLKMVIEGILNMYLLTGEKLKPLKRFLNLTAGTFGLLSVYFAGGTLLDIYYNNSDEAMVKGGMGLVMNGIASLTTLAGNLASLELELGPKFARLVDNMVDLLKSKGDELTSLLNELPAKSVLTPKEIDKGIV